jgi:hypothetical protein
MNYNEKVLTYLGAYLLGALFTGFCLSFIVIYNATPLEGIFAIVLFGAFLTIWGLLWGKEE